MKTSKFQDQRLNARLKAVLSQWAARPTASIPAACGGFAEMAAAYRFVDNPRVTPTEILAPHRERTLERIGAQQRVFLVQDTTEIDLTRPEVPVRGAGPLDDGPRQGAFLHPLHAFDPDGTPLGTVHAHFWTRPAAEPRDPETAGQDRKKRPARPFEEKESRRWVDMLREAERVAQEVPDTQIVCVADSEADIFEMLVEGQAEARAADWIVRACQDRAVLPKTANSSGETTQIANQLFAPAAAGKVLFTNSISVRGRRSKVSCETRSRRRARVSRQAEVEVRATRVTLRPPWRCDGKLPAVEINVVLVREINPPAGEEPVEWLLLTSLPIDTIEQVREIVRSYCVRWMIEVFFRTLKSGCRVEQRRFETIDRQLNCLAIYLIVAWRTLYVCRLGRGLPEVNCEAVFEPAEWKAVYRVVRNQRPPSEPPRLREMLRMVAQLGGYVNKPRSDEPGPQTVWLGLQRAHDFALCWQRFGPEARNTEQLV